jgi:hypothetical protein
VAVLVLLNISVTQLMNETVTIYSELIRTLIWAGVTSVGNDDGIPSLSARFAKGLPSSEPMRGRQREADMSMKRGTANFIMTSRKWIQF